MRVTPFEELPLRKFPTNAGRFRAELEGYLQGLSESGTIYLGYLERAFNKSCYRLALFHELPTALDCKVIRAFEANIINYPSSEKAFSRSAQPVISELGDQGYIFSGSFPRQIGASKEVFWIFYRGRQDDGITVGRDSEPSD